MSDSPTAHTPDSPRPTKRARVNDKMADIDDWDDVYAEAEAKHQQPETEPSSDLPLRASALPTASSDIPAQISHLPPAATSNSTAPPSTAFAPPSPHQHPKPEPPAREVQDGIPADAIDDGNELVAEENEVVNPAAEEAEAAVLAETTEILHEAPVKDDHLMLEAPQNTVRPADDPEFLAAAAAQKDNNAAEWQFDSSDAESSSDSSDSDSSSDSDDEGSEEDYEMLDPAALAKILMTGDGEDDEGGAKNKGGKSAADAQPRTANEIKDVEIIKPDIEITPDTKITFLGIVERVVENMALVKGATPGEYQVLESGSVLCNEAREVLGAVADTFGRVQEPLYSVAFTNVQAIKDAGLEHGSKVYYVDEHSTFVFTQPLRNLKGTDASNIHDEEVAEHEAEFSDDEAEAEAKRAKKQAKQAARGGAAPGRGRGRGGARSFGAPGHDSGGYVVGGSDAPTQTYGGGMSYDDDDDKQDQQQSPAMAEFYSPLKRPENLSELMAGGPAPPRPSRGGNRGGRGGRGDRGGRGGRGNDRGRGGRGGRGGNETGNFRGNAHSFPDRHNATGASPPAPAVQHGLPSKPSAPQGALLENPTAQQTYQFGGYQFQFNAQQQPLQAPPGYPQQQQQMQIPGGAYVNPAFFGQQGYSPAPQQNWGIAQQPQQQSGQQWNGYPGWGQQQQYQGIGGQQQGAAPPPPSGNLADILKTLGGAAPPPPPQ